MEKLSRIYVAGHRGLVGSAICRALDRQGYENLLLRTRAELDLTDPAGVRTFFESEKPDYVFLAAAKVGGILANNTYPADFIRENLSIQTECHRLQLQSRRQAPALSRVELHLSKGMSTADERRIFADRATRAHESPLCARKDCRYRNVLVV